jgi:hypothetical protein
MSKNKIINFCFLFISCSIYSQSNLEKILRGGELVITGISVYNKFKGGEKIEAKVAETNSNLISSICIKNKLIEKITFKLVGKDEKDNEVKKELVLQADGKECVFEISKGIYTYEVILTNKEIFQKGEYKFDDEIVITIKKQE